MQRSVAKILTTHVGSLPFLSLDSGIATGDETHLRKDVAAVVAQQRDTGIDIVNEGEYAKGGDWLRYMLDRFGGFTDIDAPTSKPLIEQGKDREEFADFYKYANERGTLFYAPGGEIARAGRGRGAGRQGFGLPLKRKEPWRRAGENVEFQCGDECESCRKASTARNMRRDPGIVGIAPARSLNLPIVRSIVAGPTPGERMPVAPLDYFDAGFPGASQTVRITSLHDAKVFARRWVIRDKDPALKALLRHMEKANSSATADIAIRQLKQALACRGMLVDAIPLRSDL